MGMGPRPGSRAFLLLSTHRRNVVYPPLWCVCGRRRQLALQVVGCFSASARCFHLALRGRVLFTPSMPRGDGMLADRRNQTRRRKSISHAMLPSQLSPHAAAGFTGVRFKECQQRQLFGLPDAGVIVSPPPSRLLPVAHAGIFLGLRPRPAARPSYAQRVHPCLLQHQDRLPYLAGLALDGGLVEPLLFEFPGAGRAAEGVPCAPDQCPWSHKQAVIRQLGQAPWSPQQHREDPKARTLLRSPLPPPKPFPDSLNSCVLPHATEATLSYHSAPLL